MKRPKKAKFFLYGSCPRCGKLVKLVVHLETELTEMQDSDKVRKDVIKEIKKKVGV